MVRSPEFVPIAKSVGERESETECGIKKKSFRERETARAREREREREREGERERKRARESERDRERDSRCVFFVSLSHSRPFLRVWEGGREGERETDELLCTG